MSQAKREATREKRIAQMLDELKAGDAYKRMPYRGPRGEE
ncbi:YdeI/OmpD-associated family protein [Ensifer aridi]|nr:YdeI/OmpD-associated family protein [Ensifer aridi]